MSILASKAAEILNKEFGATNYTPAATLYIGLRSGGSELSGSGYARVSLTNNTTNWTTTSTNQKVNAVAITFPAASADWLAADEVAIYTASSGGSPIYTGNLDPTVTVRSGQTREFAAGDLTIRMI